MLSQRLARLVELCGSGDTLWDVGCDHGLAGIRAAQSGQWRSLVFVDPSEAVIRLLKETITAHIPKGFFYTTLQQRMNEITRTTTNNVYLIAGLGGEQIAGGLKHLGSVETDKQAKFILGPHRDWMNVRQALRELRWLVLHEEIFLEEGQFYPIIVAENRPAEPVSLFGTSWWLGSSGQAFREHLLRKLSSHQDLRDQELLTFLRDL